MNINKDNYDCLEWWRDANNQTQKTNSIYTDQAQPNPT